MSNDEFFQDAETVGDLLELHGGVTITVDAGPGCVYSVSTIGEAIFEDPPVLASLMQSLLQRAKMQPEFRRRAQEPDAPDWAKAHAISWEVESELRRNDPGRTHLPR